MASIREYKKECLECGNPKPVPCWQCCSNKCDRRRSKRLDKIRLKKQTVDNSIDK